MNKDLNKPQVQAFELKKYVLDLGQLPSLPEVILTTPAEKTIWNSQKRLFLGASLWLRNMLLGEALLPEAYQSEALYCQPLAELLAADFRLATAVHARTSSEDLLRFKTPAAFWFYCCWAKSLYSIENMGLESSVGKRGRYNLAIEFCSSLESFSLNFGLPTADDAPEMLLLAEAQRISESDYNFHLDYLSPYLKVLRRVAKKIKECKHLQAYCLLPDGTLHVTSKNLKLPSKKQLM